MLMTKRVCQPMSAEPMAVFTLQATKLGDEVKTLKEAGAGAFFKTMALPEGMSLTSSDVIASLNEHLIQSLQVQ